MDTFIINDDNEVAVYHSAEQAAQSGDATSTTFDSHATFATVAADWPLSRFVQIWNSIPGNERVKKFTDRKTAILRTWKAIQILAGNRPEPEQRHVGTPEPAGSAPMEAVTPADEAQPAVEAPEQAAEGLAPIAEPATAQAQAERAGEPEAAREQSDSAKPDRSNKKAEVIAMMKREGGVTLAEIMETTEWQKHTVRGFVSILGKKGGLAIESSKNTAGERTYKIAK